MKKLYTLKEEIVMAGLNGNVNIGIDTRNGDCVIPEITIGELMNGEYEYLLNKKMKSVMHVSDKLVFILNSNKVENKAKKEIHKELKKVLRGFENMELYEDSLYEMLLKIEENWDVITK